MTTTLTFFQALILGSIQGVGEFLPISSSAHLSLAQHFLHITSTGRALEVALHGGTLLAVVVYFFSTFWVIARQTVVSLVTRRPSWGLSTLMGLVVATLPAVVLGYGVHKFLPKVGHSFTLMGIMSIVGGLLLYIADQRPSLATPSPCQSVTQPSSPTALPWRHGLLIGLWQCGALLPGGSRLGMTLTGARFLGYDRATAITLSYWLSVPVTLGALVLEGAALVKLHHSFTGILTSVGPMAPLLTSIVLAFGLGCLVMGAMLHWLRRHSLAPFAVYRVGLGVVLLALG